MSSLPSILPRPLAPGYGINPADQTKRTDMEAGAARVRRSSRARLDMVDVSWKFTDAQMAVFRKWFDNSNTIEASGTAQAGAASTITLAAGASATDDYYNSATIHITGGTGSGQTRTISDYVGSTKVATVDSAWTTQPDATSVYEISGGADGGAAWFTTSLTTGDGGIVSNEARFNGPWKSSLLPGLNHQVTGKLEVR